VNKIALLGVSIASLGMFLPILVVKANRLVAGNQVGITALLMFFWLAPLLLSALGLALSKLKSRGVGLLILGQITLLFLLIFLALSSRELGANPISRVAPASGFWLLGLGVWLLAYAGALEMQKLWLASLGFLIITLFVISGALDALSVLREYTANQSEFWQEALRHIQLAFFAWGFSSVLGVLLGVYSATRPRISSLSLGFANALQTIPSIALFALLIPFFSALARNFPVLENFGIRGIGIAPALTALTLYGVLPVLRGTILGLQNVQEAPLEAARGLGFTPNQIFWQVKLPLSIPLLLEGLRLAAVSLIGLAALSSLIGAGGLGGFIFTGLGSGAIDRVLLGAIPTLVLALLVNAGLRGLESSLTPRGMK
jgi:osmoprotectant transport system permease protein